MLTTQKIIIALLCFLLVACQSSQGPGRSYLPGSKQLQVGIPFETVADGTNSGIFRHSPDVYVLADDRAVKRFWAKHDTIGDPAPYVDFEHDMLIAVVDRNHPNNGYAIQITQVDNAYGNLVVHATRLEPGYQCAASTQLTQPFHVIKVAKYSKTASLELTHKRVDCY